MQPEQRESAVSQSIQEWNSVLTIHLLEGTDLPAMDDNGWWAELGVWLTSDVTVNFLSVPGFSDPYCKLKLGRQKRKSKVIRPLAFYTPHM